MKITVRLTLETEDWAQVLLATDSLACYQEVEGRFLMALIKAGVLVQADGSLVLPCSTPLLVS